MQDAGKPFAAYGKQRDATYVRPFDHVLVYMLTPEIVEEADGMSYVQCVYYYQGDIVVRSVRPR